MIRLRAITIANLVAPALMLAGCAVNTPPVVRTSAGALSEAVDVALLPSEGESGLRVDFRRSIERAIAAGGLAHDPASNLVADYGLSVQSAEVGQVIAVDESAADGTVSWQSMPRRGRLFDGCDPVRAQATLAVFDREAGELVYRSEAETIACSTDKIDLDRLARELVVTAWRAPAG